MRSPSPRLPTLLLLATMAFLPVARAFFDPAAGRPVFQNFRPTDYRGHPQVYSVAFALTSPQSKDAGLQASPDAGAYTVHVTGGTSGIAFAEIYDATEMFTSATPRLLNVAARAQVGTGDNLLIAGFVIGGSTPRNVLIRAIGPSLTSAGVSGVLADPKIALFSKGTKVAENDNWSADANADVIVTTSATVGAAALASGTKDAVLLVTLQPGVYTAHVTGADNLTGVALVEVFEAP